MKTKLIALFLLACMLLSYVSCTNAGSPAATTEGSQETSSTNEQEPPQEPTQEPTQEPNTPNYDPVTGILDKSKHYNILFIGNSYTHYNDMPEKIFEKIIQDAGYKATVTRLTKGSQYLYDSANPADELGKQINASLKNKKYDFVVLQGQSASPILYPETFYTGVRNMVEKVRANGATPILYETWGYQTGNKNLTLNGLTNETMTWGLAAGYEAIGRELGIPVAYAGLAFYDIYTHHSEIELYDDDKTHPSATGSYLAAMTIFATITGVDPTTLTYDNNLSAQQSGYLKEAARKAVFETPEIPEKYKTSSEGIALEFNYTIDASKVNVLTSFPQSALISIVKGGTYPNGKAFSGILGTKNAVASKAYSITGLNDVQKADIANIGYGVSVIGIEKMVSTSNGYETALENMIDGMWTGKKYGNFEFDKKTYNINGQEDPNSDYTGLITLNFGSQHRFDAFGFATSELNVLPGAAEVFVSDDGVNWTRVPTACWDQFRGAALKSCGTTPNDLWTGATSPTTCLFDMAGVTGQYIRIGVIVGRIDRADRLNSFGCRELFVYGEKLS